MDRVLPLLISAGLIAFGDWVVVATIAKGSPFVWALMALFPLLTGFISFYESTKGTPAPVPVLKRIALSRPRLESNLIEYRERLALLEHAHRHDADGQPEPDEGVRNFSQNANPLRGAKPSEGPMTVLIYVNTSKHVGDPDRLKIFANADAAETWLQENAPEGIVFEYEVLE
jgi:hypothetical protein